MDYMVIWKLYVPICVSMTIDSHIRSHWDISYIYPNNHQKFGDIIELLGYNTYNYGTHNWNYQGPSGREVVNAAESQFLGFQ